jgi:hypothetical protein
MNIISRTESLKVWAKAMGYVAGTYIVMTGISFATLDEQVTKASNLVLGNVAALMLGGGLVVGGAYSVYQGDISRALGQFGVAGIIGIGTALAKSKVIFNILN